jgi:hypothetical protein
MQEEEEEEILPLMSIKKNSIHVVKGSKSRENVFSFKENPHLKRTKRTQKKKNTEGKKLELKTTRHHKHAGPANR